jgi:hypothetical protein
MDHNTCDLASVIGLAEGGYCDDVAGVSARAPVPSLGLAYLVNYKGSPRYVSRLDAKICGASYPLAFSGIGIGILTNFVYYAKFGKLLQL